MFQDGAAVTPGVYNLLDNKFELTECVEYTSESAEEIAVLAQLEPTYELCLFRPSYSLQENYQGGLITGTSESAQDRKWRACRPLVLSIDIRILLDNVADRILEQKGGDTYPRSVLSDVVTQRDYANAEGNLIAPAELYSTLIEDTLVLVTVYTYINRGELQPDRKVYHLIGDKLKVLDHGDKRRAYLSSASPKKLAGDYAIDAVFNDFGKASPSSSKGPKRNTTAAQ
ncbi:hypothetical protein B0H14DRAFT_2583567 [Mycena olivaceomarginata]|nr:hypothetical protein B0H14DRAFT_2583567 [Mycena olivaceomarginata]